MDTKIMYFDHIDYSHKYLEDILCIIRQGILQKQSMLKKKKREGLNTQWLIEAFNIIGTSQNYKTWIGSQKEHEQEKSRNREDIYFHLNDDNHTRIFYVEAKRLPKYQSNNDEEYVTGKSSNGKPSGGIQRYKFAIHGNADLSHNGMIAYIENKTTEEWLQIVNDRISEEYPDDSCLISTPLENEYISTHLYRDQKNSFIMHHFWINLTIG
jgi:hypothetical protein